MEISTPHYLTVDRTTRQERNKGPEQYYKPTRPKLGLPSFYRTFHPTTVEYTFFSTALGTFSTIYKMLGHKFQ